MSWIITKRSTVKEVYQFKIALQGISPSVWRRIQVSGDYTFDELHNDIQLAMGWTNSHLHEFQIGSTRIGMKSEEFEIYDDYDEMLDETKEKISTWFTPKSKASYLYDFGDSWEHSVTLEKIFEPKSKELYPICTAGKRACPPEDCGGVWGYKEILNAFEAKKNKKKLDDDMRELIEWSRIKDPEKFNPEKVVFYKL